MKKRIFKIIYLSIFVVFLFSLCACQSTPENRTVASKNDGAFDANAARSASEHHDPEATQAANYVDSFFSTDGTVEFRLNIDEIITAADMPVVEVAPHMLTEDDVERVAKALFGNAEFRELDSYLTPLLSKQQIQEKMALWVKYSSTEALGKLYGEDPYDAELVQTFIDRYSLMYETAPENNPKELTNWGFKDGIDYWYAEDNRDGIDTSAYNDEIALNIKANGITYLFSAAKRDKATSKLNNIVAYPYGGISPDNIESRIYYAMLCRTNEPTTKQVENVKRIAQDMLDKMDIGIWSIDQCYVSSSLYGHPNEYIINIDAVPEINGVAVARQDQFSGLNNNKEAYAFNYYLTNAHFGFNLDGKLVEFELDSPIDIVRLLNDNVAAMDIYSLIECAKNHLVLSDYYEYGFGGAIDTIKENKEDLSCIVTIDSMQYNLLRVNVPNSDSTYYYVPGIIFSGSVEYIGQDSGQLYYTYRNPSSPDETVRTLIALNAIDGTVIRTAGN